VPAPEVVEEEVSDSDPVVDTVMPRRSTRERREPDRYKAGINSVTVTDNKQLLD
jgi:hypothetical protein